MLLIWLVSTGLKCRSIFSRSRSLILFSAPHQKDKKKSVETILNPAGIKPTVKRKKPSLYSMGRLLVVSEQAEWTKAPVQFWLAYVSTFFRFTEKN